LFFLPSPVCLFLPPPSSFRSLFTPFALLTTIGNTKQQQTEERTIKRRSYKRRSRNDGEDSKDEKESDGEGGPGEDFRRKREEGGDSDLSEAPEDLLSLPRAKSLKKSISESHVAEKHGYLVEPQHVKFFLWSLCLGLSELQKAGIPSYPSPSSILLYPNGCVKILPL
jgi:hypothetical protein